jgi:NAD-dependent dihydropyrimidine dehydrogenase PreA subunit
MLQLALLKQDYTICVNIYGRIYMTKRKIISIDEDKCNGCGLCIPNCPEGALQLIDGKARMINDMFCDGLGACIGHCPEEAITIEEREAEVYDERKVMENIVKQGANTIVAHLEHLKEHNEVYKLKQALAFLDENGIQVDFKEQDSTEQLLHSGCPGARIMMFDSSPGKTSASNTKAPQTSELRQWPVQLHLVPPSAPYFQNRDVVLTADCVAYSLANFHERFLKGKSIAIACPKLDQGTDIYIEKLKIMIDGAKIKSLTVIIMEVPCCSGLYSIAQAAADRAVRKIVLRKIVTSIKGEIL